MPLAVTLLWSLRLADGGDITPHGVYLYPDMAAFDQAREQAADPSRAFALLTLPLFSEEPLGAPRDPLAPAPPARRS